MSSLHQKLQKKVPCSYLGRRLRRWYPIKPLGTFFCHPYCFFFCNFLQYLALNIKVQVFGRSNDVPRPSVVEEIKFSEEVACGGYHTCVVTGINFVLRVQKSKGCTDLFCT
jgi:hypothetical protein